MRIDYEFSRLSEFNSPSGTHFMVRIADEFLKAASSNDLDILSRCIKSKGINFSTFTNNKGLFALTAKQHTLPAYTNGSLNTKYEVLRKGKEYTLLHRSLSYKGNNSGIVDPAPFIVVWKFTTDSNNSCYWQQGHYCSTLYTASELFCNKDGLFNDISGRISKAKNLSGKNNIDNYSIVRQPENSI